MVKICPLCMRTYPDNAKVCPLGHCPNCGSTNIEPIIKDCEAKFLAVAVFIGLVISLFLNVLSPPPLLSISVAIIVATLAVILYREVCKWRCNDCGATFPRARIVKNVALILGLNQSIGQRGAKISVCPVCGAPVVPGASYCWRCGAKLS